MRIEMPAHVEQIIEVLNGSGFEAYAVGGCVRDALLDREPGDWDITTSAAPMEVKRLFPRTVDTGLQHGTVTVLMDHCGYEVTTYRIDGEYEDGRHPKSIEFTSSLTEDLKRRDFTINAMAYSHESGIIDEFGGMEDLRGGIIRCVGRAMDRFNEDALRILRAIRFSAQLGFDIEEETKKAISVIAPNLQKVSMERIQVELTKLLVSDHPEAFCKVWETGVSAVVLPEFDAMMECSQNNPYHNITVGEHTLKMLALIPNDRVLRWTALLHDTGKLVTKRAEADGREFFPNHAEAGAAAAKDILKRFKMDNEIIDKASRLIRWHAYPFHGDRICVRRALNQIGDDIFADLLIVMEADTRAQSQFEQQLRLDELDKVRAIYQMILADGDCYSLKGLAVNGNDLMAAGIRPGKHMGALLNRLLGDVIENQEANTREELLKRAFAYLETGL